MQRTPNPSFFGPLLRACRRARPQALALALLMAPLAGCLGNALGSLGSSSGSATGGLSGGQGGSGGNGGSNGGGGYFVAGNNPLESSALHRLNAAEYNNSVRDLLGTTLAPAGRFSADEIANGYDNNAAALGLTTARLQDYDAAAEALAAELVANADGRLTKLAPCTTPNDAASCVRTFVTSVGGRAWRRPLSADEVSAVVAIATGVSGDSYAQQVQKATEVLLTSPYFLYRIELGSGSGSALTGYELAARLSYFLWSSTPDDALLSVAADGSLLKDDVLAAQTQRMLQDSKAAAFSQNFAGQWLKLRNTQALAPDATLFPKWNDDLRQAAIAQTQASFADLLAGKIAFHALFDADTTYVNDRLATFYGMALPGSDTLVSVPAGSRRGLLTQAAVLAATSLPNRTSLVHRGQFVMAQLLCTPPPAAPANVPALSDPQADVITQRQRLEAHVTNASCAVCHKLMDPYGYVLEPFDAIGAARTTDNGGTIDPSATLADGTKLASVADLSDKLAKDPRVPACMVQQLATYALGRTLVTQDTAAVNALQSQFLSNGQRLDLLVQKIVQSPLFRSRSQGVS